MQATRAFSRPGISGRFVAVVLAVVAAFVLGVAGGFLARSLLLSGSTPAAASYGTVTTLHQTAPDAKDRNAQLRPPVCDSSICNPNAARNQ
jgi:hypothetical protein